LQLAALSHFLLVAALHFGESDVRHAPPVCTAAAV